MRPRASSLSLRQLRIDYGTETKLLLSVVKCSQSYLGQARAGFTALDVGVLQVHVLLSSGKDK